MIVISYLNPKLLGKRRTSKSVMIEHVIVNATRNRMDINFVCPDERKHFSPSLVLEISNAHVKLLHTQHVLPNHT